MAITGKFAADFASFYDACQRAETSLKGFESGSNKVEQSLNRMTDSFSGRKIISDATLMTEAIDRAGGVSTLTGAELATAGAKAAEAAEKMRALGIGVPAQLQAVADAGRDVGAELTSFGNAARDAGGVLTAALTVPIVGVGAAAIKLGIDATESRNLIEVSFGGMTSAADAWAANLSKSLGLNRYETEKNAAVLYTMTTGMGLGKAASFEMSTGIVKLAGDMASFRDIPMEEALAKIKSGLVGESEPLKQIGILVNDATVKTYAYANGIAQQGTELTDQQKVLARYGAILQQTSNDQGDLARTGTSPANMLRIMKERVTEAATALGISLMPTITTVIGGMTSLLSPITEAVTWFGQLPEPVKVGGVVLLALTAAAGPALLVLGQLAISVSSLIPLLVKMGVEQTTLNGIMTTAGSGLGLMAKGIGVVAAAYAGWKLGEWLGEATGLNDWIDRTVGKMMGLSTSEIEGSLAARKWQAAHKEAIAPVADLAAATASASATMAEEAKTQAAAAATAAEAEATRKAAIAATNAEHAAAVATAKKYAEALEEMNSAGEGYRGTLETMTKDTRDSVTWYLQAGVSQAALATAYGLTATQVKAVASALGASTAALALEQKSVEEIAKVHSELAELKIAHGGTATDAQIAQVDRWFANEVSKLSASDANYAAHYAALSALAHEKLEGIHVDWSALGTHSQQALQETADKAIATYSAALNATGQFTQQYLDELAAAAEAAQAAANGWPEAVAAVVPELKAVEDGAKKATQGFVAMGMAILSATEQAAAFENLNAMADRNMGRGDASGISAIIGMGQRDAAMRIANGMPSFATGGAGDFGSGTPVMLHGKERSCRGRPMAAAARQWSTTSRSPCRPVATPGGLVARRPTHSSGCSRPKGSGSKERIRLVTGTISFESKLVRSAILPVNPGLIRPI